MWQVSDSRGPRAKWKTKRSEIFEGRFKRFERKSPPSVHQALANLRKYMEALFDGQHPMQIKAGFIHSEGNHGAIAIDASGIRGIRQIRLYVFPDTETKTLWLVTIGDKQSQRKTDLPEVKRFVKKLTERG